MTDFDFKPHAQIDGDAWNTLITENFSLAPFLQTYQWAVVKAQYGWTPFYYAKTDATGKPLAAAIVLERTIRLGGLAAKFRMHYVPKGPLIHDQTDQTAWMETLAALRQFAKRRGAFLSKVEPEIIVGHGEPGAEDAVEEPSGIVLVNEMQSAGWHFSEDQIQFRNTVLVDLTRDEDQILADMKQKTRYNVRLASRKDVTVRTGTPADFEAIFTLYAETAVRDGFAIRGKDYYLTVWQTFFEAGMMTPVLAEYDGQLLASLIMMHSGKTAWYFYGMSSTEHRNLMSTYLIQFEAMKIAKEKGCTTYDLWGAPAVFDESDELWGVYRFKQGLGGTVQRSIGAYDLPIQPLIYKLYTQVLPRVMNILRSRGKRQTRSIVE